MRPEDRPRPWADMTSAELNKRLGRNWDFQRQWTPEVAELFFERLTRCKTEEKQLESLETQGLLWADAGSDGVVEVVEAIEAITDDLVIAARARMIESRLSSQRRDYSLAYARLRDAVEIELAVGKPCGSRGNSFAYLGLPTLAIIADDAQVRAEAALLLTSALNTLTEDLPYNRVSARMGLAVLRADLGEHSQAEAELREVFAEVEALERSDPSEGRSVRLSVNNTWRRPSYVSNLFPLIGPPPISAALIAPTMYALIPPDSKISPDWLAATLPFETMHRYESSVCRVFEDGPYTETFEWLTGEADIAYAVEAFGRDSYAQESQTLPAAIEAVVHVRVYCSEVDPNMLIVLMETFQHLGAVAFGDMVCIGAGR